VKRRLQARVGRSSDGHVDGRKQREQINGSVDGRKALAPPDLFDAIGAEQDFNR
jgi:hypothetical protein